MSQRALQTARVLEPDVASDLAVVLIVTKSLYAAWIAHFAWNWVMAVPLHVNVSGLSLGNPDYQVVDAGPDWATVSPPRQRGVGRGVGSG